MFLVEFLDLVDNIVDSFLETEDNNGGPKPRCTTRSIDGLIKQLMKLPEHIEP